VDRQLNAPPAGEFPVAGEIRRPPYGRNPVLAAAGMRARTEMIDAARELFARHGYQGTTVESIGEATGRSGAAVYQYFEGKAEIFGIFLREAGADLCAVGDRFPVLTDDDAGRRALAGWVADLIAMLGRHHGTFLLWAQVQFNEPALAAIGRQNLDRFQTAVLRRLAASGAHPPVPGMVAVGILSVVQWSYFVFVARFPQVGLQRVERALATVLHAYLFGPAGPPVHWPVAAGESPEVPSLPLGDALGLRRPVTARGLGTIQRILQATTERYRELGYQGTSLTDVATAAGVSHGSVYTYWKDREAVFRTLAQDALAAVELRVAALPAAVRSADGLDNWLDDWMCMLDQLGPVLFVWTHEVDSVALAELTDRVNHALDTAAGCVASATGSGADDPAAMVVVLRAVLIDVPYVLSAQLGILHRDAAYGFVAGLLHAGSGVRRSPSAVPGPVDPD
jgi:AcrR family transcriptional regulator